ncbi:DNA polymerase [Terribacillus sp. 179-K 1B1 HS]|uniref:DNA polymerase n=1 Tax=Terribacillus sp. 179-K 1B1 HS TaxID=3142388 RepID=UPI0039A0C8B7
MPELKIGNLRLNETNDSESKQRIASAEKRKAAATETLDEGFDRILATKLSDKERNYVMLARSALADGKAGRTKGGKLSKAEAVQIGKEVEAGQAEALREQRAKETLANKPPNYFILTDDNELPAFVERIREEVRRQREEWAGRFEILGVDSMTAGDFEGTGIDAYMDLSIGFSIWLPLLDEGYYLPYGHIDGFDVPYAHQADDPQLTRSKVLAAISPYLSSPKQGKTFHMGAARYDLHIAENDGYTIRGCVWDTLDAMQLMNEHEERFGLKPLIEKYGKHFGIDGTIYTFEDLFGNRSPAPFNTELVGIYAINDVKYGWGLCEWQFETMPKFGRLLDCYAAVDKDLPETDVFLERSGFILDADMLRELESEFKPKIAEAERRVFDEYGIDDEFVRKMDRTINAPKIQKWIKAQQKRIEKKQEQISKKKQKIAEMQAGNKTHLKSYQSEVEALAKYEKELSEMPAATDENAPQEITEFSITNGNHLKYLIYDFLEIEDKTYKIDRGKKRSTSADVLDMYYEDEPKLEPLAKVAEYTKLLSTYIEPMLGSGGKTSTVEIDGRLHSNFKAGGTATGRYSSSSYTGRPTDLLSEVV